jgi:hypothetical protein
MSWPVRSRVNRCRLSRAHVSPSSAIIDALPLVNAPFHGIDLTALATMKRSSITLVPTVAPICGAAFQDHHVPCHIPTL